MKKCELIAASVLALVMSMPAYAQELSSASTTSAGQDTPGAGPSDYNQDEDIIVTATKRAQTLQDVPISVSVTALETIERAQIRDLIDLQSIVPSLKVTQFNAVGQTNFIIRGFGNGNGNDGIESSVGVFIDGVYRSRSAAALDDLPEVERIEVLRGPQSTLFGKNVSAGAISIVTKRPQFEWGGKAEISYGNYHQMQGKATITGPLTSTVAVRLSGSFNFRDGYFDNVTTGSDINNRDRQSVRGDVLWEPSSDFSLRVIADYNVIKEVCCGVQTIFNGPATQFIGAPAPFGLGKNIGDPAAIYDRNVIFNTDPSNRVRGKGVSAQADYDLGGAKLTSITAYRNQINESQQDIDFTAADISNNTTANEIKTFTQELRLASQGDGPFSYLIGGFYQDEKLDTGRDIRYGSDIRGFANGLSQNALIQLETLQSLVNPAVRPGLTYFQPGQGISDRYKLKQRSYSVFGQADYRITNRLTVTGGLAYLNDRKEARSSVVMQDPFSALNLQNVPELGFLPLTILNPAAPAGARIPTNLFGALGALQFFYGDSPTHGPVNFPNAAESGVLKGDKFTYAARIAYDLDLLNVYASYSTGWKAGAFNLSSDSRPPDVNGAGRTADPEDVAVYEVGAKAKFRGGYVNLALFQQTIKGFQSNAFTGLGYSLVNAGEQSVRGFEVDAAYRPISFLSLTAAATYLDPKYDSFIGAPCVNYDSERCPVDPATGRRPNFRDLSGDRPAGIPTWSLAVAATISHDLAEGINGYVRGEYDYTSKFQLIETTPPELSTVGSQALNASAGLTFANQQLEVMVWGRNLTNYNTLISSFPTVAQDGSYSGYPNQPRTYGVTLRKTF
ncbi:TonB-dependent receptor [Sphingomonas qilianensis]|uniref:TonB-dependent receptor n=1 Tax=Sphingomonas qilianensis TaxID=1736690 RepID=A0ABU9XNP4_9SPHN